jgi:ABC-type Fe3+-siderophore transport system permease subunit
MQIIREIRMPRLLGAWLAGALLVSMAKVVAVARTRRGRRNFMS